MMPLYACTISCIHQNKTTIMTVCSFVAPNLQEAKGKAHDLMIERWNPKHGNYNHQMEVLEISQINIDIVYKESHQNELD